jgi:hypothetical protein
MTPVRYFVHESQIQNERRLPHQRYNEHHPEMRPVYLATDIDPLLDKLFSVLQALYDVQNGCPLPKYEKDWNAAMKHAEALLNRLEGQ